MVAFLVLDIVAALCLAGRVLGQEQPDTLAELEVLCTPMKKKPWNLEEHRVCEGRRDQPMLRRPC